jgi:cytoskeletal protein CcmA (bactofilin family)
MFGRKKGDAVKDQTSVSSESKPRPAPVAPALNLRRPVPAQPTTASTSRLADIPGILPPRGDVRPYGVEGKTLVVGREISLAGQIAACDKLVVEGRVEAELEHCRQLDVSATGFFKGSADIDEAEISGRVEGNLVVRKRLRVRSTARIKGSVTYSQIEVEAGGEIVGDVQLYRPDAAPAKAPVRTQPAEASE